MKIFLFIMSICFLAFPLVAQDHILIDCIHGADYSPSYNGPVAIDFQAIFPNAVLTIMSPDSLPNLTLLVDEEVQGNQTCTYIVNLPDFAVPEEVQTLYVSVDNETTSMFNWVTGSILNPEGTIVENLYGGNAHIDGCYGSGWQIQIELGQPGLNHIRIGYGSTLFSNTATYGKYDLTDYDAVLRIYDSFYLAYMMESPDYSTVDLNAITTALSGGLSFFHAFSYMNAIVDKPFIHMYTENDLSASVKVAVPGTRTLALPIPEGDGQNFEWNQIQLKPNSQNEHVYETTLNQKLNFIDFDVAGNSILFKNRTEAPLHDLLLLRNTDQKHFEIGICSILLPGITSQIEVWKTYDAKQARMYLQNDLYRQCLNTGLSEQEANHFAYELPWVDALLLRATKQPDQYFGIYHFDHKLYDRLIPVEISPTPSSIERNMWVMLSHIQPRPAEPMTNLQPALLHLNRLNDDTDFLYREYGMVDERYSMHQSTRETGFLGINIFDWNFYDFYTGPALFYDNPFADELSGYASSIAFTFRPLRFIEDDPVHFGIFYDHEDALHPYALAKRIQTAGRVLVLGSSFQFAIESQYPFLNSAMYSLIHSPNLGTGNTIIPVTDTQQVEIRNYPNPFNPSTAIRFSIPSKGKVDINLYNMKGQLIKHVLSDEMQSGTHSVLWDGTNENNASVASQVVLCRMQYGGVDYTRKMVLMK